MNIHQLTEEIVKLKGNLENTEAIVVANEIWEVRILLL